VVRPRMRSGEQEELQRGKNGPMSTYFEVDGDDFAV